MLSNFQTLDEQGCNSLGASSQAGHGQLGYKANLQPRIVSWGLLFRSKAIISLHWAQNKGHDCNPPKCPIADGFVGCPPPPPQVRLDAGPEK